MVKRFKSLGPYLYIVHIYRHVIGKYYYFHRRNVEGRARGGKCRYIFYNLEYFFLPTELKRAIEKLGWEWRLWMCVYSGVVQINLPPLSNLTLQSKFIVPVVDSPSPLNIISQVKLTSVTRVCYYISEKKCTSTFSTLNVCVTSKFHSRKCCNIWL